MKKILLIQTGGTIAMNIGRSDEPPATSSRWSQKLHEEIPELSQIAELQTEKLFLEDSSDINRQHWGKLIRFIEREYENFDGFVILHGTDTMAYTASALSFGLQNLSKPVILTGSQVPISSIRSDARRNLVNAIEMATLPLNEVAICFNDFIYRGNRTTKMSIGDFDAFASPNFPPLAEIGLNIDLRIPGRASGGSLKSSTSFDDRLFLLKLFPSLDPGFLNALDVDSMRALVLEAFGSGNFPIHGRLSLLPLLERCIDSGITTVITSQAPYDAVDLTKYKSGRKALELGAIGAGDMTTEAVLTKLMHLLATHDRKETIEEKFRENLAGEITE